MNDREHRQWVREIVLKPVFKKWGSAWELISEAQHHDIVSAKCMDVVMTWACSPGGHDISKEEVTRLYREAIRQLREKDGTDEEG